MKLKASDPNNAAVIGFLLPVSFFIINFLLSIISAQISSVTSLIFWFLLPVGAYIAAQPMLKKNTGSKRQWYPLNMIVATVLLVVFVYIFFGLIEEMYRCDILKIPNCD